MKSYLTAILIIIGMLSIFSCAKEGMPQGGPRDTIPPVLVKSTPVMNGTDFNKKTIVLKFNEYFDLKDINTEFFASPPFAEKPKFKISGKKLIIAIKDTLRDSVTYTLEFGNAIVDHNEGNVLENFKFTFSTYDKLDTLRISGYVKDAYTNEPEKGVYVMLYKHWYDSIPYQETPQYVTKTDSSGFFEIKNIRKARYRIFALDDLNKNFIYDGIETRVAFLDSILIPTAQVIKKVDSLKAGTILHNKANGEIIDTLKNDTVIISYYTRFKPDSIYLRMFEEKKLPQQITVTSRMLPYKAKIKFTYPPYDNYFDINPLDFDKTKIITEYEPNSDSLILWFKDSSLWHNELNIEISYYKDKYSKEKTTDTVTFKTAQQDSALLSIDYAQEADYSKNFSFTVNMPVIKLDTQAIDFVEIIDTLVKDTRELSLKFSRPEPDIIIARLNRNPVKFTIKIPEANPNSYAYRIDTASKSIYITLSNELAKEKEIPIYISCTNERFFGYKEKLLFTDTLPVESIKIISAERTDWKKAKIIFSKPVRNLSITQSNVKYSKIQAYDSTIIITFREATDTIKLDMTIYDFTDIKGKKQQKELSVSLPYKWHKNDVRKKIRTQKSEITLLFDKPILGNPVLYLRNYKAKPSWYTLSVEQDTMLIKIRDKAIKRLNPIKFIVKLEDKYKDSLITIYDTVEVKVETPKPELIKTEAYRPLNKRIKQDSSNIRKYDICSFLKPEKSYMVILNDSALRTIDLNYSTRTELKFTTLSEKDFANLKVLVTDSLGKYNASNLILMIEDSKGKSVLSKTVAINDTTVIPHLKTGKYKIKLIVDSNKNGVWDTGNYLKDIQPEEIIFVKQPVEIKPEEENLKIIELK